VALDLDRLQRLRVEVRDRVRPHHRQLGQAGHNLLRHDDDDFAPAIAQIRDRADGGAGERLALLVPDSRQL
jgi:hypothetical protein